MNADDADANNTDTADDADANNTDAADDANANADDVNDANDANANDTGAVDKAKVNDNADKDVNLLDKADPLPVLSCEEHSRFIENQRIVIRTLIREFWLERSTTPPSTPPLESFMKAH